MTAKKAVVELLDHLCKVKTLQLKQCKGKAVIDIRFAGAKGKVKLGHDRITNGDFSGSGVCRIFSESI